MSASKSTNEYNVQRPDVIPREIVITGMSGRLPESSNMEEFADKLFSGVDMVNDDPRRWPAGLYDLPSRFGKIKEADLENFDQHFFGVNQKQAECMDPQLRLLMEITYEAIIDAGKIYLKYYFICTYLVFSLKIKHSPNALVQLSSVGRCTLHVHPLYAVNFKRSFQLYL